MGASVKNATPKVEIACRIIENLHSDAQVTPLQAQWQAHIESIKKCDVIIGCVDSFLGRSEIELLSRRYLFPYIDMGMDVFQLGDEPPRMVGQVILSMPGGLCMRCLGFITDENLAAEGTKYGDAGGRPQVEEPSEIAALLVVSSFSLAGSFVFVLRRRSELLKELAERKTLQEEQNRLISSLEEALANVETLRELLPICGWCKKIRDDRGYWTELEAYLQSHMHTTFTHGICPECAAKFDTDRRSTPRG